MRQWRLKIDTKKWFEFFDLALYMNVERNNLLKSGTDYLFLAILGFTQLSVFKKINKIIGQKTAMLK